MTELQQIYETTADELAENGYVSEAVEMLGSRNNEQPAAIIDPPRTVKALRDKGLIEYQVWGWVKMSAKFIAHIRRLKGAKLGVWQVIALSIDETGKCRKTIKEICELTDYSHTEIINSIRELQEMGYLTVQKDPKGNIYDPEFVARGELSPSEDVVKKVESTPVYPVESTPAIEKSLSTIKSIKRVNLTDKNQSNHNTAYLRGDQERPDKVQAMLDMLNFPGAKQAARLDALLNYLGVALNRNVETKEWKEFAKYILSEMSTKGWHVEVFVEWVKSQKGYPEFWSAKRMREYYPQAFETSADHTVYLDSDGIPLT